jgi:lipid-binding SYLF domain-containing protein
MAFGMSAYAAPPAPRDTLLAANEVLSELTKDTKKAIPKALMKEAEAVVVFPHTIKAGLVIGGRIGHGVAIIKDKNGGWGDIRFLELGGASVGFQIGVEATDVVLVFKNRKGLDRLLDGKNKLKLGADASVAAGPVGREAEVATDLLLKSEIFSYSRSRGLFAGASLEGVILSPDAGTTALFEKDDHGDTRKAADSIKSHISLLAAEKLPPAVIVVPGDVPPPPPAPVIVPGATPPPQTGPVRRFFKRFQ